jgi:aminoglycoside 3-N-acetyltransferase
LKKNSGSFEKSWIEDPGRGIHLKKEIYIPYCEIAQHLPVEPGTILWLAADLTKLAFMATRKEGGFDAFRFIRSFQDKLGPEGTLVIPSFNHNLEDHSHYSRNRTLPITGALATEAMKMGGFRRTSNPLHSFLVSGKHEQALTGLQNESSFGPGSPFEFLHNYQAKMLVMGTSLSNAFTFVHYVEELHQVKYRKYRTINVFEEDDNSWKAFRLFAKRPGWTMDMQGLEKLILGNKAATLSQVNGINCTLIDLAKAFPIVEKEIESNRARNIARFSSRLYLRDLARPLLAKAGFRSHSDIISHDPGLL